MSTFMAKKETLERKWYVIDAADMPLGKTAVAAADILRGKHRPEFTPNVDCGEFVIVINERNSKRNSTVTIPAISAVSNPLIIKPLWLQSPNSQ